MPERDLRQLGADQLLRAGKAAHRGGDRGALREVIAELDRRVGRGGTRLAEECAEELRKLHPPRRPRESASGRSAPPSAPVDTRRQSALRRGRGTVAHGIARLTELQDDHRRRTESHDLHPEVHAWLSNGLCQAPSHSRFVPAARHIICAIHSIPDLFENVERGDLELYVGRAAATPGHVYNRFRDHHTSEKGHQFGMVVLRCETRVVALWEGVANRAIKLLQHRRQLCVANVSAHGGGSMPAHEESSIYITWKLLRRTMPTRVTTRRDVVDIADEIAEQEPGVARRDLQGALVALASPERERTEVAWDEGHAD